MKPIYAHYHQPESYPAYQKRQIRVTTRDMLENRIQFMSLRGLPQDEKGNLTEIKEALDLYTKRFDLGKVFWMNANAMLAGNLDEFLDEVKARDGYVFDIWGFVPGSYHEVNPWKEYDYTDENHKLITEKLGDHFIGYDNGEQDGRYIGAYTSAQCPARQSHTFQTRRFYEHFETMANQLRQATTALCSLNYGHFFARENNCYMLGAETAQALPNANLWYAYLRGAGKQYGLLWFGNASVYNRFSWKSYDIESSQPMDGYSYGPRVGTSLSLLRRLLYTEYLYNSDMLGYEAGLVTNKESQRLLAEGKTLPPSEDGSDKSLFTGDDAVLSPIGELQADCIRFTKERGRAGVMYTPVAILLNSGNGWCVPRHLYQPEIYRSWGQMPYTEGDHQLHALFSMLYPGYEDSGFFLNERGFMTPTPYGDMADVLMSDLRREVLRQYRLAILAGWQKPDREQADKFADFVQKGGRLAAFADQLEGGALNDLFGVKVLGEKTEKEDILVTYRNKAYRERNITLYKGTVLKDGVEILAAAEDGTPLAVSYKVGKGEAILVLSPYGMDGVRSEEECHNAENASIPMLYRFLESVRALLGDMMREEMLAEVDNPNLGLVVNLRDARTLTVTLINNGFTAQPYRLTVKGITEASRREIALPDVDHESAGYFPPCSRAHGTFAKTEDGQKILEAGQMVMWEITLAEELPFAEKENFIDSSRNFYAALRPEGMLLDTLLAMPTLDQSFKGIKLDASTISDLSLRQAKACGDWLKRRGLDVMVDFAPMLDHYPHISFIRNREEKLGRNRAWEEEILEKAKALGATKALLMHHRNAENHRTVAQAEEDMQLSLRELAALCESYGMKAIVMNGLPNAVLGKTEDARRLYPEYACAVNLSHSLLTGEELSEKTLQSAAGVLISTPLKDEIGQVSDAHLPLTGSCYQTKVESLLKKLPLGDYDFVVLDGDYRDYNALYLDRKTVGEIG